MQAQEPNRQERTKRPELPPNRMRELRNARGLKLYDISAMVRSDPATVSRWERGTSPVPDEVKLQLAAFYEVTVPHLMGWPDKAAA